MPLMLNFSKTLRLSLFCIITATLNRSSSLPFYLGCYVNVTIHNSMPRHVTDDVPFDNLAQECANFCKYSPAGEGIFSYAGVRFIANARICYCFNDLEGSHTPVELALCNDYCFQHYPNEDCKPITDNSAKVWTVCDEGYYGPPRCEAKCPVYCRPEDSGVRTCGENGKCLKGCRFNLCSYRYTCQDAYGLEGITPVPAPSQITQLPDAGLYIFPNFQFTANGTITHITYLAKSQGVAYISVWRNSDDSGQAAWSLVGKVKVEHNASADYVEKNLTVAEEINVEPGDVVGIHHEQSRGNILGVFETPTQNFNNQGSKGEYSFNSNLLDFNWETGYEILLDSVQSRSSGSPLYFPDFRITVQCGCPSGCQEGLCNSDGCTNGCVPGQKGWFCDSVCSDGEFGLNCAETCSSSCKTTACDSETGLCLNAKLCDAENGMCIGGCETGYLGRECTVACLPHFYGDNCTSKCSSNCIDSECDNVDGHCIKGCLPGFKMPDCQLFCDAGFYGLSCSQPCGNCSSGASCDPVTGDCPGVCEIGLVPSKCVEKCPPNYFGLDCRQRCGHCVEGDVCDSITGDCPGNCSVGYYKPKCSEICSPGSYGVNCEEECGFCQGQSSCLVTNGVCEEGCIDGYMPPSCKQECLVGKFGDHCLLECGHCKDSANCSKQDGSCPGVCEDGYKPPTCRCPLKFYGVDCDKECGECKDGDECDEHDGSCPNGCLDSTYIPPLCLKAVSTICEAGFYGPQCSQPCGNCAKNETGAATCLAFDGSCPDGCQDGYQGPLCTDLCDSGTYGKDCDFMCGMCRDEEPCWSPTGHCSACEDGYVMPLCLENCKSGFYGYNCKFPCGSCASGTCDPKTGVCPGACTPGWHGRLCKYFKSDDDILLLSGNNSGTSSFLSVNLLFMSAVILFAFYLKVD